MAIKERSLICVVFLLGIKTLCNASEGDSTPAFRTCVEICAKSGCVNEHCIEGCGTEHSSRGNMTVNKPWELKLTRWSCNHECQFQCMTSVERIRAKEGLSPIKYYGKWPFTRVLGAQEPASVVFSLLNLLITLYGLLKFISLVYNKLPRKPMGDKGPLYEYSGLWILYGFMSLNSWFWSAVFHTRDTPFTQSWDYSSAIALIGAILILAIIRTANLRLEAPRVMVSAPIIGFTATHILYLNFYNFDYGWNIKVCIAMGVFQLVLWVVWSFLTNHPSRVKLWIAVVGTSVATLLEVFDFPPLWGVVDAHAFWHAATIPLLFLWWSFISDDAIFQTERYLRNAKQSKD